VFAVEDFGPFDDYPGGAFWVVFNGQGKKILAVRSREPCGLGCAFEVLLTELPDCLQLPVPGQRRTDRLPGCARARHQ